MKSQKGMSFVNPVQLCGLVVFIMSAPKVLTQTNCECLVLSKQSGDEWIDDCADTTTELISTTYTITTPADVADPSKQTEKPAASSPPDNQTKATTVADTLTTKATSLTLKPSTKASAPPSTKKQVFPTTKQPTPASTKKPAQPSTKPAVRLTSTLLTTKLITIETTVKTIIGKPIPGSTAVTAKSSQKTPSLKPTAEKESQAEPVSEPGVEGGTVGGAVGAVVGLAAIISAVVLFWKFGVLKKCYEHSCRSSKVSAYDVENGDFTKRNNTY